LEYTSKLLTKKRERGSMITNSFSLNRLKDNSQLKRAEVPTTEEKGYSPEHSKSVKVQVKQKIVNQWVADRIKEKLHAASRVSLHSHKPVVLYRKIIEEMDDITEEEISFVSGNHIINIIYVYGGFVPTTFKTMEVFTLDKFTKWFIQEGKREELLQCLEELEK
jgi:hypothetical protein